MVQSRTVQVRRVVDPPRPDDGARVLVDRLWPRGKSREGLVCIAKTQMLTLLTATRDSSISEAAVLAKYISSEAGRC